VKADQRGEHIMGKQMATPPVRDGMYWTSQYPHLTTEPIPIASRADPVQFELEREKIFKRCWLIVGREEQIAQSGDYLLVDRAYLETSIIVVRGKDNQIRAFHNMCSHRGTRIVHKSSGNCRGALRCILHGWVYDTQGKLVYVNGENRFSGLDRVENGLTPVHVDVWKGFIFINLDPNPRQTLLEYLDPLTERLGDYPFGTMHPTYRYVADEPANWKTAVEAQQEGWHVASLHGKSFARDIAGNSDQFEPPLVACYGYHAYNSVTAPATVGARLPIELMAQTFSSANVWQDLLIQDDDGRRASWRHNDLNNYFIFPNTLLSLMDTNYLLFHFWPTDVGQTVWEFHGFGIEREPATAGVIFADQFRNAIQRQIFAEDVFIHSSVQSNIRSGAKKVFHLHDTELTLRHMDYTVNKFLNAP
jgi:phenylpropionate dioxygenase-like ring-hydroxylating dioxygenase large terminal subunit